MAPTTRFVGFHHFIGIIIVLVDFDVLVLRVALAPATPQLGFLTSRMATYCLREYRISNGYSLILSVSLIGDGLAAMKEVNYGCGLRP